MLWSEFRVVLSVLCLVAMAGCGFQLQKTGSYPPAMSVTYLEAADQYTVFYRKLSDCFQNTWCNDTINKVTNQNALNV